jgi:glycosyltransferase involved in cell wall biosynthesis
MKKILNILTLMEPGGVQQREFMFRSYSKKLYEIKSVFLYKKINNQADKKGVCLFHKKPSLFKTFVIFFKLIKCIREYKPDLIMTWGWTSNSFGILASLFYPKCKRIVMQTSTAYQYKFLKGRLRLTGTLGVILDKILGMTNIYNLNIIVSEHNLKSYSLYPKSYLKKCKLIFNGISLNEKITNNNFEHLKNKKLIGSIGRLSIIKNHISIIKSLKYIYDAHYIIIGQGPEKENILKESKKQQVDNRVTIIENISHDQIYSFLKTLSVFMFPSLSESFGLAVMEAMSIPLPAILIEAPWSIDMFGSNFPSIVKNDPKEIAQITNKVLSDAQYAEDLKRASSNIAKKYDFSNMANSYLEEIKKII